VSIKFEPSKIVKRLAPKSKIKKALGRSLKLKKEALSFVSKIDVLDKKDITRVALKTIKSYKARVKDDPKLREKLLANPAQLIQRVQNEVVLRVAEEIKTRYAGESYRWLPSDADEPDPEHQLNYGEIFLIGDGEMPGDRYGCKCGMEILVDETQLNLG